MNKEGTLNKPHFLNKEILKYRKPNSLLEQRELLISPTKFTSSTSTLLLNILHSKLGNYFSTYIIYSYSSFSAITLHLNQPLVSDVYVG